MPPNLVAATLRQGLFTRVVGKRFLYYQELGSTMDEASRRAEDGAEEGLVVVAETQTAGRGRMGRNWVSQQGNLYLSVLFRPTMDALPYLSVICGVAAIRAIRQITGLEPRIKWPNDILLDDKKAGGILVESVVSGQDVWYAVAGIGINVRLDFSGVEEIADLATTLDTVKGSPVSREDLLRQFLQDLDNLYFQLCSGESPLSEWRDSLDTLGQRVEASWRDEKWVGLAEDIDDLGNLKLRLDDGSSVTLTAGDVTLRPNGP